MSRKSGMLLILFFMFFQISQIHAIASESYIENVFIDVDSFKDNPWNIFGVYIDADTPSDEICENVTSKIHFFNFSSHEEMDNSNEPWEVCGTEYHPNIKSYSFDPESIEDNSDGSFACSIIQLSDNAFVDSYNYSLGLYGNQNASTEGNIYSNGNVILQDNAYIRGNVSAHAIDIEGNGYIEGEQNITDKQWDCMHDAIEDLRTAVSSDNNNLDIGDTSSSKLPFSPEGSLNFKLNGNESITLNEGIYYFESLHLSGNSSLNFSGRVIIFCEQEVSITGKSELNFEKNPNEVAIYSFYDDIEISGQAQVFSQLYAVQGIVQLNGNCEIFGKIFADKIVASGNAKIHFNTFESDKMLQFAFTYLFDDQRTVTDKEIDVFLLASKKVIIWKLEVENGNFSRYNKVGDTWVSVGRYILKGYGDYNLIIDHKPLEHIITVMLDEPTDNLFSIALEHPTNGKRLNFVRCWATSWSTLRRTDADIGNFPWACTGTRQYGNKTLNIYDHTTYVIPPSTPPGISSTWHYYRNRLDRVLEDALKRGVVIEMDFFDNSMMKVDTRWPFNPYNPANQNASYQNELTPSLLGSNISPVSYPPNWPTNGPPVSGTSYPTNYFFWGANHGGAGYQQLPTLGSQQQSLVYFVAGVASFYNNVFYEPTNEPYYVEYYGNETSEWHKQINNWVLNVDPDALFGINMYEGAAPNMGMWESLIDVVSKVPGIDVISYHSPYWTDFLSCAYEINGNGHVKWSHIQNFNAKVCLLDDDGTWNCRKDNNNVYAWALATFSDSTYPYRVANFTHKDYFWNNEELPDHFEIDYQAINKIYDAWTDAGSP